MEVKQFAFGSTEYRKALQLREQVLRRPLGLKLSAADTAAEQTQYHFGLFEGDALMACIIAKPLPQSSRMKFRQMAVTEAAQGKGLGRQLLLQTERLLIRNEFQIFELSARKTAEGFYRQLGYRAEGGYFLELGIDHVLMYKQADVVTAHDQSRIVAQNPLNNR